MKKKIQKLYSIYAMAAFCFVTASAFAAGEVRISTTNQSQALTELKAALANPEVEKIVLLKPNSGLTALNLPDGTELFATTAKRKIIQVEKPFMPEDGRIVIDTSGDENTLVTPAVGDYSGYKLFEISRGAHVVISNVVMMGGFTGTRSRYNYDYTTGGIENNGLLEMYNCDVLRTGTAVLNNGGARLVMRDCNIVRNANWYGGGVINRHDATTRGSSTALNFSLTGGTAGIVIMDRCSLTENQSLGKSHGGGAGENQGLMCVNNCIIANNASTEIGGGLNNCKSGRLYLMNSTLIGNVTTASNYGMTAGGAIGNAGAAGSLNIVNTYMGYNGFDNGRVLFNSSVGRFSGSSDRPACTMDNTIYDAISNITFTIDHENTSTAYEGLINSIESASIISAGLPAGQTSAFRHPQLASVDNINDPYHLQPVMLSQEEGHYIFANSTYTYFDYSGVFNANPDVIMAFDDNGTVKVAGAQYVRAPEGDHEMITSLVEVAFDGTSRDHNFVGAVPVPIKYPDMVDEDDVSLFWVQLDSFTGGAVSGVTIYRDAYRSNSVVTVRGNPSSAHYLDGWMVNGQVIPNTAQKYIYSFTVTTNLLIKPIFSPVQTKIITARQRYPWNNLVDIDYSIAEKDAKNYRIVFQATYTDEATGEEKTIQLKNFVRNSGKNFSGKYASTGNYVPKKLGEKAELQREGIHRVTWDSAADGIKIKNGQLALRVLACEGKEQ